MTRAPSSAAISATIGEAPPPVPPPMPAMMKTRSQSFTTVGDLLAVVLGGLAPEVGIAAGAEPAGRAHPDQDLVLDGRTRKRLAVGVDDRELEALEALHLQAVDGVRAGPADAHQLDGDVAVAEDLGLQRKFVRVHVDAKSRETLRRKPPLRRVAAALSLSELTP